MEKYFHFDRNKTLEEFEGQEWEESDFNTHLIDTCLKLRKKPIAKFTVEDLRIMIGQKLGLDYLIPLALEVIDDDILANGDFYPGDLLEAVLKVNKGFWRNNSRYRDDLEDIMERNIKNLNRKLSEFRQRNT